MYHLKKEIIPIHDLQKSACLFPVSQDFVMDQRKQQYNDLLHALRLMRRVDNSTSTGILVLKMYKLETGMLTGSYKKHFYHVIIPSHNGVSEKMFKTSVNHKVCLP
jgi:hypothetical protein